MQLKAHVIDLIWRHSPVISRHRVHPRPTQLIHTSMRQQARPERRAVNRLALWPTSTSHPRSPTAAHRVYQRPDHDARSWGMRRCHPPCPANRNVTADRGRILRGCSRYQRHQPSARPTPPDALPRRSPAALGHRKAVTLCSHAMGPCQLVVITGVQAGHSSSEGPPPAAAGPHGGPRDGHTIHRGWRSAGEDLSSLASARFRSSRGTCPRGCL